MTLLLATVQFTYADPLPSWRAGETKNAIIDFVSKVTAPDGPDYVTPAERIAVFDNDGTLWAEQPVYFQLLFAMSRVADMAEEDPTVLTSDVLRAAASADMEGVLAEGEEGLIEIVAVTHSGMTVTAFQQSVSDWLASKVHPDKNRPFTDLVYQPMLELLRYLRDNGFETYIVSGGGIHFMRAFTENAYGIPPENVIGSIGKSRYEIVDGAPVILKDPGLAFIDDKEGKPIGIDQRIGRRPIFVAGNSDGDFAMLEWATAGSGQRLGIIVHHTDADREWAYDRDSPIGRLDRGLDEADDRGWFLIDMKADWRIVFPERP
ncbi:MAG: HAD family hydrolase [Pseudomonadota bacterium]